VPSVEVSWLPRHHQACFRHLVGFVRRPMNKMLPARVSRIRNRNGWSARNTGPIDLQESKATFIHSADELAGRIG